MHPDIVTFVEYEDGSLRNQKEEQHKLNQNEGVRSIKANLSSSFPAKMFYSWT